jgi:plasmid stability protein
MVAITIKNIPNELYESLKNAANAHHRSINNEIIACLEKAFKKFYA